MSTDEHITDPAPPSRLVRLESLNREFEQFISEQNESRKSVVWRQVNRAIWRQLSRRVSVVVLCSCLAVLLVSYIPQLNWSAAAVGRMALIQVLPYWNWTHYHRDRCIWEKKKVLAGSSDSQFKDASCDFCESIATIPIIRRPSTFEFERFIKFHQPFVVQKSHRIWAINEIANFLIDSPNLANSVPCDLQSNLQTTRNARLMRMFEHTIQRWETHTSKWFFAFRNCDFAATKATRPLWPRPAFIPLHLRPFHTSWLIVASDYPSSVDTKPLELRGLAAVAQLTGRRVFQLLGAGSECARNCPELAVELWAGETLVFLADMWRIRFEVSERTNGDVHLSVTYVAEFEWDETRW